MCSGSQLNGYTDGLERLGHDLRAVVDREDNICDASIGKGLDLVLDHGLVGELNKRLGVCEGLRLGQLRRFADGGALVAESTARGGGVQEASDEYQTLRRE